MTETITVRLRRSKAELQAKAKPNLNAWVNDLIDQALGPKSIDWDAHFKWRKKQKPVRYCADEIRNADR
jgi:hypothetical protein